MTAPTDPLPGSAGGLNEPPYVAHDWRFHGWLPSGRGRYSCLKCPARTTRGTDPPVAGTAGRCGSCPGCGGRWDSALHWITCLGRTMTVRR